MAISAYHDLHTALYSRFQKYNLNLQAVVNYDSSAELAHNGIEVISYLRSLNEAQTVEGMMGRELPIRRLDLRRHPVIELRANADSLVLELIVPPDAWWDQQNLVGKLAITRHRQDFCRLLSRLDDGFLLGFWRGTDLDAMHLTAPQASHPLIFDQWITTFSSGQDWFRVGAWYDTADCDPTELVSELFHRAQSLYSLYNFISWTGGNDFRSFYERKPLSYAS